MTKFGILLLVAFIFFSKSYAGECEEDINFGTLQYSEPRVEFLGKLIPLRENHIVKVPTKPMVYIVSRDCNDVVQFLSIKETSDCIFCHATSDELRELGVEVVGQDQVQQFSYLWFEVNGQSQLNIWNSELALTVKDQNDSYLNYILEHYGFDKIDQ